MNNKTILFILIVASIIGIAFQYGEQDLDPAYQKYLDEKIKTFKRESMEKCKAKAIEEAETIVDSIFRLHLSNLRIDSIFTPSKGQRPTKPDMNLPKEKKYVAPIIGKNEFDSIDLPLKMVPDSINY